MDAAAVFAEQRPKLFGVAYRMLGSVADAEDIVQETYLRWQDVANHGAAIDSPSAYLTTMISRRCLDELRSARRRREEYVGEWLPEPLLADDRLDPAATTELSDSISTAFLVVLEALSPGERAAFLLHDVFGYEYPELARIIGRAEPACRQLVTRARKRVAERRPRFEVEPKEHERLLTEFLHATQAGDLNGLVHLLADDAVLRADGGGVVTAARNPLHGPERIARWSIGVAEKAQENGITHYELGTVNGLPGVKMFAGEALYGVITLDLRDGLIQNIYIQVNPAKLHRPGILTDGGARPEEP
jgi:RNA polymerase sigma-70 factor (ECF subfamily)